MAKRFALPRRQVSNGPFYKTHRKNSLKERPISMGRFVGGLIIRMDYYGKTTKRFKTAFYLIINANHDGYTHVFDIDFVPSSVLKFLISLTKNKKLEDFLFSRSTFSYYNFGSYDKSLYRRLLPIMNRAYRKLIRNPTNIRRTYVIDYDFGKIRNAIKPKFIFPKLEDEDFEIEQTAMEFDVNEKAMFEMSKTGRLVTLTPTIWATMRNTDSWQTGITQEEVRRYANMRGKDVETTNRIIAGMKSSQTFYAPIIFKYFGTYYCVAGNTRLMTAMSLKVIPKVYIFAYDPDVQAMYAESTPTMPSSNVNYYERPIE